MTAFRSFVILICQEEAVRMVVCYLNAHQSTSTTAFIAANMD